VERGQVTVLVVEDDSMARSWLRLALEGTEFRVAGEAATPAEAADLLERRRPVLLLIDYHLAGDVIRDDRPSEAH
jgi:DNA-binding NarL/FixJ family response regulator